jgi:Cu(I)/Ag(I) efflux system membrane protein CusA/SilA
MRELRDHVDTVGRVLVAGPAGTQVPLLQLTRIRYVPGPEMIRSEGSFVTGYVLFDRKPGRAETNVVEEARDLLAGKIRTGELDLPAGVSFAFTGSYENDLRAGRKLALIVPLALLIIFFILYLQFRSAVVSALVFSGVAVAWAGGLITIWLYGQPWFLNFDVFGTSMRDLFQVHPINLSVAVWVGFLALFGIAEDDGVVMATYLRSTFAGRAIRTVDDIRAATIEASLRRVRPCLMTTATTILALIPVLTSTGRGSDLMVPMAIPSFGGMILEVMTMLVVPVLYCLIQEIKLRPSVRSTPTH